MRYTCSTFDRVAPCRGFRLGGWENLANHAGPDDLGEAARVEAGPADQGAVDVRLGQEIGRVGRLDAAAVLDAHLVRGRGVAELGQDLADMGVGVLLLLGAGGLAGAEGPSGGVGAAALAQL